MGFSYECWFPSLVSRICEYVTLDYLQLSIEARLILHSFPLDFVATPIFWFFRRIRGWDLSKFLRGFWSE